jgi:hypothetical protein
MRPAFAFVAVALAGCSLIGLEHNDPPPVFPSGEPDGILVVDLEARPDGMGLTVTDALASIGGDAVAVRGAIFIDDLSGAIWLCHQVWADDIAPTPSCERPALLVQHPGPESGLPASALRAEILAAGHVGELQQSDGVRWSDDASFSGRLLDPLASPT